MGKYNTQLIPAYESPVVGGEGLGAGNLLEANQAKVLGCHCAVAAQVEPVKPTARPKLTRPLQVGVPTK